MAGANRCSGRGALTGLLLGAVFVIAMMVPTASASVIDESADADHGRSLKTIGILSKLLHWKVHPRPVVYKPVYHHVPVVNYHGGKKGRKLQTIGILSKLLHWKVHPRPVVYKPVYHPAPVVKYYGGKKGRKLMAFE